jgi:hypothetical protein
VGLSSRDGIVDGTERVPNNWTEQAHHRNDNDCHECQDDRILDQSLSFLKGEEKHKIVLSKNFFV